MKPTAMDSISMLVVWGALIELPAPGKLMLANGLPFCSMGCGDWLFAAGGSTGAGGAPIFVVAGGVTVVAGDVGDDGLVDEGAVVLVSGSVSMSVDSELEGGGTRVGVGTTVVGGGEGGRDVDVDGDGDGDEGGFDVTLGSVVVVVLIVVVGAWSVGGSFVVVVGNGIVVKPGIFVLVTRGLGHRSPNRLPARAMPIRDFGLTWTPAQKVCKFSSLELIP